MEISNPYGFIYITTNMINGKKYIGQKRFIKGWKTYLGSGIVLKKAVKKYGRKKFHREIIAIAYSKEELNNLEIEFIKLHNAVKDKNYYNIATGGSNANTFAGKTKEEMKKYSEKMSKLNSGKNNPNYGNHKLAGENNPMYGVHLTGKNNHNYGKHFSNEIKQKIREANKGKFSGEKNYFYGKHFSRENHPQAKQVICITTGKIFGCIKNGADFYNCNKNVISRVCKGKGTTAGKLSNGTKLVWMYYEDYLNLQKAS